MSNRKERSVANARSSNRGAGEPSSASNEQSTSPQQSNVTSPATVQNGATQQNTEHANGRRSSKGRHSRNGQSTPAENSPENSSPNSSQEADPPQAMCNKEEMESVLTFVSVGDKNSNSKQINNSISDSNVISSREPVQGNQISGQSLPYNSPQSIVPYNWQATKATVKDRLAFMFHNEIMCDVHFIVSKGLNVQRIPAHKFVLSIGSAVFDAMFNGGMATTSDEIELPDVEPAAFNNLLQFLYSDALTIEPETVMTTLYTAKKYAVPALEKACVEFLKANLNSENAFMLLTQARLFDEPQLALLCLETIDKNTSESLAAEGFTDIDQETLCVVLERDTLGIRECKLFSAVCSWAKCECERQNITVSPENQRKVLGSALYLIRFPLMSVEEFAVGPAQIGLLTDREVVQLFLYFTVNPKPEVSFQDVPRCCLTGKEQVVSRFCHTEHRWGYSGTSDRVRFVVNRRIFVVGFGLYGSIHGPTEYVCSIQIIHTDTGKMHGHNDMTFKCDGSNSTFRVMFKEPVEILPNTNYTACSTLKGPDSYYGTKGLRKVTHDSVSGGKVSFQFSYAAGNNNGTSVEDGQIPEIIFYTCQTECAASMSPAKAHSDKKSARVLPTSNQASS